MPTARTRHVALGVGGLAIALAWAMVRSGFTMSVTATDLRDAALAWPVRLDSWMTEFYADSPLYILAFKALGLSSTVDVVRLGFWSGLLALGVLTAWIVSTTGTDQRWRAGRLLLLSPIVAVLYVRIGTYDTFTVLAWAVALWLWRTGRRWGLVAGGALLGIQHFEQAFMGGLAVLCVWYALRSDLPEGLRRLSPVWLLPGLVLGKAALLLLLISQGQSALGRSGWIERFLVEWTKIAIVTLPYLVWSLFAGLWLVVVLVFLRSTSRPSRLLLAGAVAIGLVATAISGDRPRVFVLVLLPALALMIIAYLRRSGESPVERTAVEAVAWLAPPIMLAGKLAVNVNIIDNGYVSFSWIAGLGGP